MSPCGCKKKREQLLSAPPVQPHEPNKIVLKEVVESVPPQTVPPPTVENIVEKLNEIKSTINSVPA